VVALASTLASFEATILGAIVLEEIGVLVLEGGTEVVAVVGEVISGGWGVEGTDGRFFWRFCLELEREGPFLARLDPGDLAAAGDFGVFGLSLVFDLDIEIFAFVKSADAVVQGPRSSSLSSD